MKKKILLIGDSIREGYDSFVKEAFSDVADVFYPSENCRFAQYIVKTLADWKEGLNLDDDIDLIHWNAGLWDSLVLHDGKHLTDIKTYAEHIDRVCNMFKLLFPKAKIIFATSTPIIERLFADLQVKRYNSDIINYNKVAIEIVKKHGCEINDLFQLLKDAPESYHSDRTHYYTKIAVEAISKQVIVSIENALDIKAKDVNYTLLFNKKFIGM